MKDWLGNQYDVGDKVIYAAGSGRSITMVVGEVTRIWGIYRDHDSYEWVALAPGQLPPFQRKWNHDIRDYENLPEREEILTRVQVLPLRSSRWEQHSGHTRYIDTRSGKGVDLYRRDKKTGLYVHMSGGYYENTETGVRVHADDHRYHQELQSVRYWDDSSIPKPWIYVRAKNKDYIQVQDEGVKPVTLTVTKNITKWTGEVPDVEETDV